MLRQPERTKPARYQAGHTRPERQTVARHLRLHRERRMDLDRQPSRGRPRAGRPGGRFRAGIGADRVVRSPRLRPGRRRPGSGWFQTWGREAVKAVPHSQESEGGVSARASGRRMPVTDGLSQTTPRTGPAAKPSTGSGPASEAGRIHPISLVKPARSPASTCGVVPISDGEREHSVLRLDRRSSEGPANRLGQG